MTYDLYIGDRAYSSWSLRGWLLVENFGLTAKTHLVDFNGGPVVEQVGVPPAKTVPTLVSEDGAVISESMSIAEELASRHPEAGIWPSDPVARATARTLAAEMASSFMALRGDCPMNMRTAYVNIDPSDEVIADLRRLETIWAHAREITKPDGPWLCGAYSAADAFYAPVAARIAGYDLPVNDAAQAYVEAHLADPAFRRWRAMGLIKGDTLPWYAKPFETRDWPGPKPMAAHAVDEGSAENERCPYSGDPVTHLGNFEGRIFGFCNAFCRDKTVQDASAWPDFMAIYQT